MAHSQSSSSGHHIVDELEHNRQNSRNPPTMARSASVPQRLRNEGLFCESWVEISSRPSSSSLSSIGEEIITTGLRVQRESTHRRRRRQQPSAPSHHGLQAGPRSTSSQEEYEESESDDDHVMTSSNEHIPASTRFPTPGRGIFRYNGSESDDNDDENATALAQVRDETTFTPQPNAFSHPPVSQNAQPQSAPDSYFPQTSLPSSQRRPPYSTRSGSRMQHTPYNALSPTHRADSDAALRASLTTLLSCAAAARGLPKRGQSNLGGQSTSNRIEPTGIRLVPESEIMGPSPLSSRPLSPSTRAQSNPSVSSRDAESGKRKAVGSKASVQPRAAKKKKVGTVQEALISPTLLTWLVSAGVLVVFSVVGFGAGYALGKEAGRQETLGGFRGASLSDSTSCGKEVARSSGGLRRFRWGTSVGKAITA